MADLGTIASAMERPAPPLAVGADPSAVMPDPDRDLVDRATSGDGAEPSVEEKPAKPAKEAKTKGGAKSKSKSKAKSEVSEAASEEIPSPEPVKLLIRLDFSSHEKLSEQRWVDRIPTEDPFQAASPKVIKPNDTEFADTEKQFEYLA